MHVFVGRSNQLSEQYDRSFIRHDNESIEAAVIELTKTEKPESVFISWCDYYIRRFLYDDKFLTINFRTHPKIIPFMLKPAIETLYEFESSMLFAFSNEIIFRTQHILRAHGIPYSMVWNDLDRNDFWLDLDLTHAAK